MAQKDEDKKYTIRDDGVVDVAGDACIGARRLTHIPIQFGKVGGTFYCHSNKLTSLAGCPTYVGKQFHCFNNKLTTLEGCPVHVGGDFTCEFTGLTTLEFLPSEIGGHFLSKGNPLVSHTIGLLLTGCRSFITDDKGGWVTIIKKYLNRPNDIFDCQIELYENGFDEHAQL